MHETIDSLAFNKTKFNYAYQIATETGGVWSIGLGAGFNAMQMERAVTTGDTKGVGFTADLGIVYSSKKANFSLSCTQLNNGRLMDSYSEKRHLVLMTDYIFGKDEGLQLKPQVFVMTDLVKVTYDINAMVFWKQKLGAGVTFRSNEDLSFSLNWDLLKKFRIGYAYDLVLGDLKGQTDGSHTAFFGLVFK
jgi:type IX secretion system PorP/SprF family membrane protein